MLVTAILEAFNAKWIVTPTQHMLQDRGNPWETLIHDFKVHLNYVRLYLYFIYRFISHIIYNLFALLEYWEHRNNAAERLLHSEHHDDCVHGHV